MNYSDRVEYAMTNFKNAYDTLFDPPARSPRCSRAFTMPRAACAPRWISRSTRPGVRQLAAICTDISALLKAEIESTPGRVRRLLRPRPPNEIAPGALLDAIDVSDTEMLVEFVDACRSYANELAVNEVTARTWLELQHYLETADKGAARCAAAGRRRRPAVPAIAGRSRDPLLQDGVRRGLRRASGQGGRDCRADWDRSSASPCGPEQRAIAAPRLPLPPH